MCIRNRLYPMSLVRYSGSDAYQLWVMTESEKGSNTKPMVRCMAEGLVLDMVYIGYITMSTLSTVSTNFLSLILL